MPHDLHLGPLRPDRELLRGGGPEGVGGAEQHLFPLLAEAGGQLADGGGLAHAVHPHHEDDGGLCAQLEAQVALFEALRHDLHKGGLHVPAAPEAPLLRDLPQPVHRLGGGLHPGVGHNHGGFQVLEELLVLPGEGGEEVVHGDGHALAGLGQAVFDFFKKSHGTYLSLSARFFILHRLFSAKRVSP